MNFVGLVKLHAGLRFCRHMLERRTNFAAAWLRERAYRQVGRSQVVSTPRASELALRYTAEHSASVDKTSRD